MYDWLRVLNLDKLAELVYIYDHDTVDTYHPDPDTLPWPVLLLLGGFSRKQIFSYHGKFHFESINKSIIQFVEKMKW